MSTERGETGETALEPARCCLSDHTVCGQSLLRVSHYQTPVLELMAHIPYSSVLSALAHLESC